MPSKITATPLWELDVVNVYISGENDHERGDVLVVLYEDARFHRSNPRMGTHMHGHVLKTGFDLTVEQAESLGKQLIHAANEMRKMDNDYKEYCETKKKDNSDD